jgi:hypothetical protein
MKNSLIQLIIATELFKEDKYYTPKEEYTKKPKLPLYCECGGLIKSKSTYHECQKCGKRY